MKQFDCIQAKNQQGRSYAIIKYANVPVYSAFDVLSVTNYTLASTISINNCINFVKQHCKQKWTALVAAPAPDTGTRWKCNRLPVSVRNRFNIDKAVIRSVPVDNIRNCNSRESKTWNVGRDVADDATENRSKMLDANSLTY